MCLCATVRNQVRNNGHSDVNDYIHNIFKIQTVGHYHMSHGEPLMDHYLQRVDAAAAASTDHEGPGAIRCSQHLPT